MDEPFYAFAFFFFRHISGSMKPALLLAVSSAELRYALHGRAEARNMNADLEVNDAWEIDARLQSTFLFVMQITVDGYLRCFGYQAAI